MTPHQAFEDQATHCDNLGSGFTARLLRAAVAVLDRNSALGRRVMNWPMDASAAGDSVPLRLAGGLHALVLGGCDETLAAAYPPNSCDDAKLGNSIAAAFRTHEDFLLKRISSAPQTNECARSAPLLAAGRLISEHYNMPLSLFELGASAGLNLYWDRMRVTSQARSLGAPDAALTLCPEWRGEMPTGGALRIAARRGVDLNPLDMRDANDRLRLLSYVWPDQHQRLLRMKQAQALGRAHPVTIDKADAAEWLHHRLRDLPDNVVSVVFHTIAWQYFPPAVQARGRALIAAAGRGATANAPLVWLSMEADGKSPGAALEMRLWPGGHHFTLGRADFHGRWVDWRAGTSLGGGG